MARKSRGAPVQDDVDDDADDREIALAPQASDVERLVWLLDTARRRGYRLGPNVRVGDVTVNVEDLRLAKREALTAGEAADVPSIWREHGHDPDEDEPIDGTGGH